MIQAYRYYCRSTTIDSCGCLLAYNHFLLELRIEELKEHSHNPESEFMRIKEGGPLFQRERGLGTFCGPHAGGARVGQSSARRRT